MILLQPPPPPQPPGLKTWLRACRLPITIRKRKLPFVSVNGQEFPVNVQSVSDGYYFHSPATVQCTSNLIIYILPFWIGLSSIYILGKGHRPTGSVI